MGKQSGLGARLLCGGYDISGDISALDTVKCDLALLDGTDITQSAHARIPSLRDGSMSFTSFFDSADAHPVLSALPTADELMTVLIPPLSIGSPAACLNAKQIDYPAQRGNDGSLLMKVEGQGNSYALEWGVQLTPGLRTDTAATNGSSLDLGNGFTTPAIPASTTPVTNTSSLPASVVVSGGTVSNVKVNGVTVGAGDGTYTVPPTGTITLTYSVAPTWTWTLATANGAQAYLQLVAFTGTSVTATIQQAPDNSTWTTLVAFSSEDAAPATQRVTATGTVDRYLRVITAGTFTEAEFAVMINVNPVAVEFG